MSDEAEGKEAAVVDGITPNGVNAFTNATLGIALVVKPVLTDGDFTKWVAGVSFSDSTSIAVHRSQLFANAVGAGILVYCSDKVTKDVARTLDAKRVQWYGARLMDVYYQYAFVDPN